MTTVQQSSNQQYRAIPIAELVPSKTNPRKSFDPTYIDELAKSIKGVGVVQPIVVRPLGNKGFEIVAGECRFRASKKAGIAEIPAMVRDMSDAQVITIQVIENLQRKDVTPLEEASGFARLTDKSVMGDAVMTAEQIAERVGKSVEYVYARIKLNDLGKDGRELVDKGSIKTEQAVLISRLEAADQARAVKFCKDHAEDFGDMPNVKEMRDWINTDVRMANARATAQKKLQELRAGGKKAVLISTVQHDSWSDAKFLPTGTIFKSDYNLADGKQCDHVMQGVYADKNNAGKVVEICTNGKCKTHDSYARHMAERKPAKVTPAMKAAQKKREQAAARVRKAKEIAEDRGMALILDKTKIDRDDLQLMVRVFAQDAHYNAVDGIARRHNVAQRGYSLRWSIGKKLAEATKPADLLKIMFELAICNSHLWDNRYDSDMTKAQAQLYKRYGVDPDKLRKTALAELKAAEEKKAAAAPAKKPKVQTSAKPSARAKPKASKKAKRAKGKK